MHGFNVHFSVATFENCGEVFAHLKGKVDLIVSSFAMHFCSSVRQWLAVAHSLLKSGGGELCSVYPFQPRFVGEVIAALQRNPAYHEYLQGVKFQLSQPNGYVLNNEADYDPNPLVRIVHALWEVGFNRYDAQVSMNVHFHRYRDWDDFKAFVRGLNWTRSSIPEHLLDQFDEDAAKAMSVCPYSLHSFEEHVLMITCVHMRVKKMS